MGSLLPWLAFITGFIATYWNVYTNDQYHNYFFLIYKKAIVIIYSVIYGGISVALFYLLKENVIEVHDTNIKLPANLVKAIVAGLAAKGFSDINFFNIRHHGENVPIGLRSISREIDNRFENILDAISFKKMSDFMAPYYNHYQLTDPATFKAQLAAQFSSHPNRQKVAVFLASVSNHTSMRDILDEILRTFGRGTFIDICKKIAA